MRGLERRLILPQGPTVPGLILPRRFAGPPPAVAQTKVRSFLRSDGDYMTFPQGGMSLAATDDISGVALIRPASWSADQCILSIHTSAIDAGIRFALCKSGAANKLYFTKNGTADFQSSAFTTSTNVWTWIGFACDTSTNIKMWVLRIGTDASAQESTVSNSANLRAVTDWDDHHIGTYTPEGIQFDGDIAKLAWWKGASGGGVLSKAQFEAIAAGASPLDVAGAGDLQRYYILDDRGSITTEGGDGGAGAHALSDFGTTTTNY